MSQASDISLTDDVQNTIETYLAEAIALQTYNHETIDPKQTPTGAAVLEAPPAIQAAAVLACFQDYSGLKQKRGWKYDLGQKLEALRELLLRRNLPFSDKQLIELSKVIIHPVHSFLGPQKSVVSTFERMAAKQPLPAEVLDNVANVVQICSETPQDNDVRKLVVRLSKLVQSGPELHLAAGEPWAEAAGAAIRSLPLPQRDAWIALCNQGVEAATGAPSAKWLKETGRLLDAVGRDEFKKRVLEWFPLVDKPSAAEGRQLGWRSNSPLLLADHNVDILRGLALACSLCDDAEIARGLGKLAISAYKKVPGIGPRAIKLGNACVYSLGAMPGMDALGQLALLKVRVKFGGAQQGIEKALNKAAERLNLPREEIEELAVPTYGMEEVGRRTEAFGDFTAELLVAGDGSTELRWLKADGKPQKSVPAAVAKDFAEDLKELKAAAKDIQKMLPAQRDRIDGLFLAQKSWPIAAWRERYLEHPLVGVLARRIIWRFVSGDQEQSGIWLDGNLVSHDDTPIVVDDATKVELWHPIGRPMEETPAWRNWLERHEVRQPFKQAHREVYLLTDAERNTRTYSNRFAAHVLRQHQYNALCAVRGWKNKLRLCVDDSYPPSSRYLPLWNLRAEYWVEGAGDNYGVDTNESGVYLYLTTDQVRFYPLEAPQVLAHASGGGYSPAYRQQATDPLPLDQVPPLVLSEILRDVDLFVGVASVGNDANWQDGGAQRPERYGAYWQSYSFGDLSATARTRKDVLERIIPRLKISSRCSFDERFLRVAGDLRTYKIHLGSGNILMEPNDEYLCIVPSRSAATAGEKVFLPFEGDSTLSIILSKALMLADDKKIVDTSITSQICRSRQFTVNSGAER